MAACVFILFQSLGVRASEKLSDSVRFCNWISFNKGLKAKIACFFLCFLCLPPFPPPWDWNVLESERLPCSWFHIGQRNTKICIHRASEMDWKHVKCWKSPIFEGKLRVFISYPSEMKTVSMFCNSSLFCAEIWNYLNLHQFILYAKKYIPYHWVVLYKNEMFYYFLELTSGSLFLKITCSADFTFQGCWADRVKVTLLCTQEIIITLVSPQRLFCSRFFSWKSFSK